MGEIFFISLYITKILIMFVWSHNPTKTALHSEIFIKGIYLKYS